MTKSKKSVRSLLQPKGYDEALDDLRDATDHATTSEKKHAFRVGGFMFNGFVFVVRHLINMMSDHGADIGIEEIDGKTFKTKSKKAMSGLGGSSKATEKERLTMLVGFFVAFCYELISPAVEMQDAKGRGCAIDVDSFAQALGLINNDETLRIGQPVVAEHGGVQVPVAIGNKDCEHKECETTNRKELEKLIGESGVEEIEKMLGNKELRDQLREMMMGGHGKGADA